ncbi:unnamed protein product [Lactuca virosa]|uniref:Uncharacterized protein n=1 Tax=Lactuca virosa TaxID=75947 RepID=A0AAU9LD38_9ASTR|nr:unnamed protein product [Lactuca virosa]
MILWSFNKIGKLRDTVWLLSVFEMKKDLILQARLPLLIRILVKITQRTTQIMNMVNQVKTTDTAMLLVYTFRRQDIQMIASKFAGVDWYLIAPLYQQMC